MRVKDLMELLKRCDEDAEVVYDECSVEDTQICAFTANIENVVYVNDLTDSLRQYVKLLP